MNHHVLRGLYRTGQPVKKRFSLHVCFFPWTRMFGIICVNPILRVRPGFLLNMFSNPHTTWPATPQQPPFLHYSSSHHSPCAVYIYTHTYTQGENIRFHITASDHQSGEGFSVGGSIIHDGRCLWEDWWNWPCEACQYASERSGESFGNR